MLVDDELPALKEMKYLLNDYPLEIVGMLQDTRAVLPEIAKTMPDVIFLDIDMPGMSGLELGLKIQEQYADIQIVFVTAYSEYALEAFRAFPLDYLMKPVEESRFSLTMKHLMERYEYQQKLSQKPPKTIIRCFGSNFEVYSDDGEKHYIKFATRQVKELFAYLVNRFEKPVTRLELIENIFNGVEDSKTVNLLYVTVYKLRNALEAIKATRSSITIRKNYTLETAEGVCDYIDFVRFTDRFICIDDENIQRAEQTAALYTGAYLENEDYAWVNETRAEMEIRYERLLLEISSYYAKKQKFRKCEKALLTLLQNNPLSEEGNNALLNCYIATDNVFSFQKYYEDYAALIKEELGAKPEQKFIDYYRLCRNKESLSSLHK